MEPVIIKKSREGEENANIGCLLIIVIPIIWAVYEISTAKNSFELWFFSGFILLLLLMPLEYLVISRLPLSPSIIIAKEGITFFSNIKRYSGLALVRKYYPIEEELIVWDEVKDFMLNTRYEERPNGDQGGTMIVRFDTLIMAGAMDKKDHYHSVANLTLSPEQILSLCKEFHTAYKSLPKRSIIS